MAEDGRMALDRRLHTIDAVMHLQEHPPDPRDRTPEDPDEVPDTPPTEPPPIPVTDPLPDGTPPGPYISHEY